MNVKEKSKRFYPKTKHKHMKAKLFTLGINEKGFLCSCNNQERECIRECYNILNKYVEKISEPIKVESTCSNDNNIEDEDVLEKEIAYLKSQNVLKSFNKKQFQVADSGAKNFLFIRTTVDDPVSLAATIVKDILESKQVQTRYLIRLVPVEATCKAYISNIKTTCAQLIQKYFVDSARTFSIVYNHRNNTNLSRDLVISEVADLVTQTRKDHTVNLKNPDISIVIEIIKGIALIAIIPDYFKYKKFNLRSLAEINSVHVKEDSDKCNENVSI